MNHLTEEQKEAVLQSGKNIIVSAGAGSGKTAVLTTRVIEKLKNGIKINELLILTFTEAAALEMKDRIRKEIIKNKELIDNLDLIESSYITTFDSYTLSLVRKYNYLINTSANLSIIDSGLMSLLENKFLDDIMNELYEKEDNKFLKLIKDFEVKNDKSIKEAILKIYNTLKLKINKKEFLNNYIKEYLNEDKLDFYVSEYEKLLQSYIKEIEFNLMQINDSMFSDYALELNNILNDLLNSKSYEEIFNSINISIPKRPDNSEEIELNKTNIDNCLKKIKEYLRFKNKDEIKDTILLTKDYIEIIIEIINELNDRLWIYKSKNDLYEFNDIEIMAINLLKDNDSIRKEIKDYYHEICIDEYQDTNDLQEEFINLIGNNNVYVVGDIKQSIYGFRNANPSIFKEKYDNYSQNNGGIKIDLLKNFRSRQEVIKAINEIFCSIMDDNFGGASYKETHQMVVDNKMYDDNKIDNQNYNLEILNYLPIDDYSKEEIEAFIIANDIKNKINSNFKIYDKEEKKLRNACYKDFCIILDRGTNFPIIKKIFEYHQIPICIYEDKKLTSETDIMVINNIIDFILNIYDNKYDISFKYNFVSIARSFLFEYSDEDILNIIKDNKIKETEIYKLSKEIAYNLLKLCNSELLNIIIEKFNFYEKIIKTNNINETLIRIDNLFNIADNLDSMGNTLYDFHDYISDMIDGDSEIKYKVKEQNNGVKLMNIHVSKGLEFPICYYAGLYKLFNKEEIKEKFIFNDLYGIITPYYKDGIGDTVLKDLFKNKYVLDDISERIRLFYVALTRAREKMIIVTNLDEEDNYHVDLVDDSIRRKYNSFLSFINSIKYNLKDYIYNVNLDDLNLNKAYLFSKDVNRRKSINDSKIKYYEFKIENSIVKESHASKEIHELITKDEADKLNFGTYIHSVFENADFINLENNKEYKEEIESFAKLLNINENTKIYREHEFIYDNVATYKGIIDLVLIDDDIVRIVDYKLKNIDDPKYKDQLKVYYDYMKLNFDKEIKTYLYSILDNKLEEIIIN